ncbi:MAG: hypothetical protein AB7O52_17915 [Planctomycetota bacterium]
MIDPYTQMAAKLANTAKPVEEIRKLKIKDEDWLPTPGGKIMSSLGTTPTFERLFDAFVDFGRKSNWTWDPGIPGAKKGPLLDGKTCHSGECAVFAANLLLLAQLPKPYGLEMAAAPDYWSFGGKHGSGFVCEHDLDNIVSPLPANVRTVAQIEHRAPLYLWENHKVLVHKGQVFDPSYGTVAAKTEYLGLYQCKGQHKRLVVKFGENDYVVTTGPSFGVEYLWRKVPETERPEEPFQGPYTVDQVGG